MTVLVIFAVDDPVTAKTRNIRQACAQLRPEVAPFVAVFVSGTADLLCDGMEEIRSLVVNIFWPLDGM